MATNPAVRAEIEWILARSDLALVSGDELAASACNIPAMCVYYRQWFLFRFPSF